MNVPNLRDFHPMASQAKNVDDTKMLDTTAHEVPDTVKSDNDMKEHVVNHPKFGPLGTTGRAG